MVKSFPPLIIYKGHIIRCPAMNCGCYLIKPFNKRVKAGQGIYRVFECMLCGYRFAESKSLLHPVGHLAHLRTQLRKAIAQKQGINTKISNIQYLLQVAEENPKAYKRKVQGEVIIAR